MKIGFLCVLLVTVCLLSDGSFHVGSHHIHRKERMYKSVGHALNRKKPLNRVYGNTIRVRGGFLSVPSKQPMLSLAATKILLQTALTTFNIVCWAVPLLSRTLYYNEAHLSIANSFAGGIFLMLSFGHLLPESVELMRRSITAIGGTDIGAKVLMFSLIGYTCMLFIERVAFVALPTNTNEVQHDSISSTYSTSRHTARPLSKAWVNSAVLLCIAFSLHSFFEATALGLASDRTSAYMMATCIALHQPAESVSLLVAFLKTNMPVHIVSKWLMGFSSIALVGMFTGLYVSSKTNAYVEAVIMAVTAGTFIYVGATEIANEEFTEGVSGADRWMRFGAYSSGMIVMAAITALSRQWESRIG